MPDSLADRFLKLTAVDFVTALTTSSRNCSGTRRTTVARSRPWFAQPAGSQP